MVWVIFKGPDYIRTVELKEIMASPDPNPTNVPECNCRRAVGDSSCHRMSVGDWLRSCEKTEWIILRQRGPLHTQTHAGRTGYWWHSAQLVCPDIRRKRHKGCQSKGEGGGGDTGNRKCAVERSQGDIFSKQIEHVVKQQQELIIDYPFWLLLREIGGQ